MIFSAFNFRNFKIADVAIETTHIIPHSKYGDSFIGFHMNSQDTIRDNTSQNNQFNKYVRRNHGNKKQLLLSETEKTIRSVNLKRFKKGVIIALHGIDDVVWAIFVSVITDTVRICFICFCIYTVYWLNELIY